MRIGCVPYLNAVPLIQGLRDVRFAPPRALTALFRDGELDVALLPAVEWSDVTAFQPVPGIAIAARGACDSVRVHLRRPLDEVRTVALDPHSLTSNDLARFVLRGRVIEFVESGPADAELTIGDPTLARPAENTLDLAAEWLAETRKPFVFALWLTHEPDRCGFLAEAKAAGLARLEAIAAEEAPRRGIDPERARIYLTERMHYDFGPDERAGLEDFRTWREWYRTGR